MVVGIESLLKTLINLLPTHSKFRMLPVGPLIANNGQLLMATAGLLFFFLHEKIKEQKKKNVIILKILIFTTLVF